MMKELSSEMKQYLKDIEQNVKDPQILKYLLSRTEKLYEVIFKEVENIANFKEKEMDKIEEKQAVQNKRIEEMEKRLKNMYQDVYEEDEYFEVICPYCNTKFEADIDETVNEYICPECHNTIELDWDEDEL